MTPEAMWGWEDGNVNGSESSGASVSATAGLDMSNNYCLDLSGQTAYWKYNLPTARTERYFLWQRRATNLSSGCVAMAIIQGATEIASIRVSSTGYIQAYVAGILVQTSPYTLPINTTYLLELYFKQATSGGRIVLKKKGVTVIDYTGDTDTGTLTNFNCVRHGYWDSKDSYQYIDDFVIADAWVGGGRKIQRPALAAVGTTDQFTASAGTTEECVDEVPASGTDYIYTNSVDQLSQFTKAALSGSVASVDAIKVSAQARKQGAATPQNIKLNVRSNGADYLSGDVALPTDYGEVFGIWVLDPDDSAALTEAKVNGFEIGVKSAASSTTSTTSTTTSTSSTTTTTTT